MTATGLPARIAYAVVATPLAAIGGFSCGMFALTHGSAVWQAGLMPQPEFVEFALSLIVAAAVAFPVFWWALTLPRIRLRRRAGRVWRTVFSALIVLVTSVAIRVDGVPLRYTIALMLWMAVILMFTFIRYGLVGGERRAVRPGSEVY